MQRGHGAREMGRWGGGEGNLRLMKLMGEGVFLFAKLTFITFEDFFFEMFLIPFFITLFFFFFKLAFF